MATWPRLPGTETLKADLLCNSVCVFLEMKPFLPCLSTIRLKTKRGLRGDIRGGPRNKGCAQKPVAVSILLIPPPRGLIKIWRIFPAGALLPQSA
jgi:hypothetical protein